MLAHTHLDRSALPEILQLFASYSRFSQPDIETSLTVPVFLWYLAPDNGEDRQAAQNGTAVQHSTAIRIKDINPAIIFLPSSPCLFFHLDT
jgi:hypothetical protein